MKADQKRNLPFYPDLDVPLFIIVWSTDYWRMYYRYLGDKHTDPALKGATCEAVRQANGKCTRGKNGSMLVRFLHLPYPTVVLGRLLRKLVLPEGSASN